MLQEAIEKIVKSEKWKRKSKVVASLRSDNAQARPPKLHPGTIYCATTEAKMVRCPPLAGKHRTLLWNKNQGARVNSGILMKGIR
jgi:hypothetical protein